MKSVLLALLATMSLQVHADFLGLSRGSNSCDSSFDTLDTYILMQYFAPDTMKQISSGPRSVESGYMAYRLGQAQDLSSKPQLDAALALYADLAKLRAEKAIAKVTFAKYKEIDSQAQLDGYDDQSYERFEEEFELSYAFKNSVIEAKKMEVDAAKYSIPDSSQWEIHVRLVRSQICRSLTGDR